MNFIDLSAQYQSYKAEIDAAVLRVLDSVQFILGSEVEALEHELAAYVGCEHVITCASGTDALLLSLMAIGVGPGDEVITSDFTFIATAEVIANLGATPVFVDIDPVSYNLDTAKLASVITDKTKAIIPVALYGQPADMHEINTVVEKYANNLDTRIYIIEDAAQSFGAEYQGIKSCNLSIIGCTSFFPSKPLGCYGDGGALFTNDEQISKELFSLRNHGQSSRYCHTKIGICSRLDAIQAAVLRVKLSHFTEEIAARTRVANRYSHLLATADVVTPVVKSDRTSVFAQYSICSNSRGLLRDRLNTENIPTAVHYPTPLHRQPCFSYLNYADNDFPVAHKVSESVISLPMSAFLTEQQQDKIVETILR